LIALCLERRQLGLQPRAAQPLSDRFQHVVELAFSRRQLAPKPLASGAPLDRQPVPLGRERLSELSRAARVHEFRREYLDDLLFEGDMTDVDAVAQQALAMAGPAAQRHRAPATSAGRRDAFRVELPGDLGR
jgi:hypothetical protein